MGNLGEPIAVFVTEPRNIKTDDGLVCYHCGKFSGAEYHYRNTINKSFNCIKYFSFFYEYHAINNVEFAKQL